MTATSLETTASKAKKNQFVTALNKGFELSSSQQERVIAAMRQVSTLSRKLELKVPTRLPVPDTRDMTPTQKKAALDQVKAQNAPSIEAIRAFLAGFLPSDIALLLSKQLKLNVEWLVAFTAAGDEHFTLIVY